MSTTARNTDPAGQPGSIVPGDRVEDDLPIAERLNRDPSNLGDEVRDEGDVVFPTPDPGDSSHI